MPNRLSLLLGFWALLPTTLLAAEKPHIVLILADDLGYGDVRCFHAAGKIPTPCMDRLAAQGMCFTDAHSASAVCTPTRYGILTGRYAWRTRLASGVLGGYSPPLIAEKRVTLASFLREQGYRTACVGKWHLGWDWPKTDAPGFDDQIQGTGKDQQKLWKVEWSKPIEHGPRALGFDDFFGISASLDMPPYVFVENDRVVTRPTTTKQWIRRGPAAADFEAIDVMPTLTRRVLSWLEDRSRERQPFFLYFALTAPHTPIEPTAEFRKRSGLNAYADFVMQTDHVVGQVAEALERLGLARETLIIVTSDNGCSPQANYEELLALGHNPSGPWRGTKADAWEGGHRVPFIARWPGKVAPGSRSAETICLNDFLATFAAIHERKLPDHAGEDSVSFLPALRGEAREHPLRSSIMHHAISGRFAIRSGPWKLILGPGSGGWSAPRDEAARKQNLPPVQLYHLDTDPGESKNLALQEPNRVKQLTELLERQVRQGRSTPGAAQANDRVVDFRKP